MTVSFLPDRSTRPTSTGALLGLDLTGLGVTCESQVPSADLPVEKADLARLASYTRAAHLGGVSFVSLGEQFRLRSDLRLRPDAWLDPVVAARRIGPHAAAGLVAAVPQDADLVAVVGQLKDIPQAAGSWAGLELSHRGDGDRFARSLEALGRSFATARTRGPRPRVVVPVAAEAEIEAAGAFADVVRIREQDLEWARELRYAVRSAARAAGRQDVRVLVDLRTVISADRAAARERAALIADIDGPGASWAGALEAVGTVDDVAGTIDRWVTAGAADGFVVLPGSVPADVAALLKGLLPELRRRGIVAERPAEAAATRTPAPATARGAAGRAARTAPAARPEVVAVAG
ncbi:hypothetical protein [Georgenia sp. AZ-5]|uniref:hypothetical protein n=1 Tax=Georgenia sp. AZ-5 TaxID=3367526 RepID=UPI003754E911